MTAEGVFVFLRREEQLKQINVCGRDLRAAAATTMEISDVVGRSVSRQHPVIPRLRRQLLPAWLAAPFNCRKFYKW